MISLGEITVGPNSDEIAVGSFSLKTGDDTIWVEIQRTSPDQGWPFSYGILSWRSVFGSELGSVKAYCSPVGEVYRLTVGRTPRALDGTIFYQPRSFNLAWIKKGYSLSLAFSAESGSTAVSPAPVGNVQYPVSGGQWLYSSLSGLLQLKL